VKIYCSAHFVLPLPEGHRFPIQKYALLRRRVVASGLFPPEDLCIPPAATDAEIERVHDPDYVRRVKEGRLTPKEIREIGFPWSLQMVERSRRSCGATIAASRAALADGCGVNLAGGTHHAFRDHGRGYCVFNDCAIAARAMQAEGQVQRVVILDCDVHQGDGTASIFMDDPTVFTFSIHGARNYPFRKEISDLDMALADGTSDVAYLEALEAGLVRALELARADLAFYVSGADPFVGDRLGKLALTNEGLAERDRMVFEHCGRAGLPVAVTMAGGYARPVEDTVAIHWQTVQAAATMERNRTFRA
jgi:acetoin utilization deacetylase AcuC-like enzyme